ncbi:MAG: hypothetical protein KKE37_05640 [Verrucomicrobia bacterium]|nr:hypothetical protein [Verrucomicrobiota bacterium]MBU4291238.1 hypothetical protein [Verrucomicrobiota bacterium]MBU4428820.1 hypothetical protein [Verrucomicrobiota bacterium]MCG2680964.1 hypothetical protein [Kiritimatiellia bacterium]
MAPQLKLTRQMQYVILGVMLACGVLFAVINFLVVPIITEWKVNLNKTREIQAQLNSDRGVIKTRSAVQQQLNEAQGKIRQLSEHIPLPVLGNFMLGMEASIRACANDLDVQISQVTYQDILELEGTGFRVYRVRVTARAGFWPLICLFQNLQDSNPLLSISELTILPREEQPEKHDVSFTVSWLIWVDPTKRPVFLMKATSSRTSEHSTELKPEP